MSDEVKINGVVIGRTSVKVCKKRKRLAAAVSFKPDYIGMMHADARELDHGEKR